MLWWMAVEWNELSPEKGAQSPQTSDEFSKDNPYLEALKEAYKHVIGGE